nr:MAG TPA: hypothetical protein [Caudoviricetes sp.]
MLYLYCILKFEKSQELFLKNSNLLEVVLYCLM